MHASAVSITDPNKFYKFIVFPLCKDSHPGLCVNDGFSGVTIRIFNPS